MERIVLFFGGGEGKGYYLGIRLGWGFVCKSVGDGFSRILGFFESLVFLRVLRMTGGDSVWLGLWGFWSCVFLVLRFVGLWVVFRMWFSVVWGVERGGRGCS